MDSDKEPVVKDFGYANGWAKTPDLVKNCQHKVIDREVGRFNHEVRCDICGYVYRYDSS